MNPMSDPHSSSGAPHPAESGESSHAASSTSGTATAAAKVVSGGKAVGHGLAVGARATGRATRAALALGQRAAGAEGARETGLARLLELNVLNSAGNTAVTISLAGSIFFSGASSEARGQVALFLAMTLLPFAIVAPLIGPFLDRFSHGRRWAMGATLAIRGFLCWLLADALATESNALYPLALGVLVATKAYSVTGNAAVPRLLPRDLTLVKANGRCSLAGLVGAGISAPLAGLASLAGPEWALRYAFVVFAFATIRAMMLPAAVDASRDEDDVDLDGRNRRGRVALPGPVAYALRANIGPRFMSGFLTMYMAFLLREDSYGWNPALLMGLVIGAAGVGNFLGIALASLLKKLKPQITVVAALLADAVLCGLAALIGGPVMFAVLGLTAGLAQSLAKLSLDATIQSYVPERVRTSAFARSDTMLQVAWVIGGFVGILLPLGMPELSLGLVCGALVLWFVMMVAKRDADPAVRVDQEMATTPDAAGPTAVATTAEVASEAVDHPDRPAPHAPARFDDPWAGDGPTSAMPPRRNTRNEPTVPLSLDWDDPRLPPH